MGPDLRILPVEIRQIERGDSRIASSERIEEVEGPDNDPDRSKDHGAAANLRGAGGSGSHQPDATRLVALALPLLRESLGASQEVTPPAKVRRPSNVSHSTDRTLALGLFSQPAPLGCRNVVMRFGKLALGVLLAIAAILGAVGAVSGGLWYVQSCPGAHGLLLPQTCPNDLRETVLWAVAALVIGVGAILSLRFRSRPWIIRRAAHSL
jgi:hypothetical protein